MGVRALVWRLQRLLCSKNAAGYQLSLNTQDSFGASTQLIPPRPQPKTAGSLLGARASHSLLERDASRTPASYPTVGASLLLTAMGSCQTTPP